MQETYFTGMIMKLSITVESKLESIGLDTISIAGKELVEYWFEWARHKGYKEIVLYTDFTNFTKSDIPNMDVYTDLYKVNFTCRDISQQQSKESEAYTGIGIFLDNGEYLCFSNLNDIFLFEQAFIAKPLSYCSVVGYGKTQNIHIGKNVYIHPSATLSGSVVVGDNCSIEKDVEIKDSVIDKGCLIKANSIIKNSHINKNIHFKQKLYINHKIMLEDKMYDVQKSNILKHEGLCFIKQSA